LFTLLSFFRAAMTEMRADYCGPSDRIIEPIETDECDVNEINTARDWM
jgi:hypothetical protein